ncbi:MAG TPA: hypothetical protein VIZ28_08855 [Chitinophagaceae bacterium]
MRFFLSNFKWVMLISGLLTCTMFLALFSPQDSLKSNFGETLEGPVAGIVVRNWGALIGLVGIMLIYGAFNMPVRKFTLVIAGTSKIIFISLVLSSGVSYFGLGAGTAVIADSVMVVLYALYLMLSGSSKPTTR